jgi:hypothetical protein
MLMLTPFTLAHALSEKYLTFQLCRNRSSLIHDAMDPQQIYFFSVRVG